MVVRFDGSGDVFGAHPLRPQAAHKLCDGLPFPLDCNFRRLGEALGADGRDRRVVYARSHFLQRPDPVVCGFTHRITLVVLQRFQYINPLPDGDVGRGFAVDDLDWGCAVSPVRQSDQSRERVFRACEVVEFYHGVCYRFDVIPAIKRAGVEDSRPRLGLKRCPGGRHAVCFRFDHRNESGPAGARLQTVLFNRIFENYIRNKEGRLV